MEENASWFELICMIKYRLRRAGHAAYMGNRGGVNRVLVGKLWGKRPGVDGRIILKWILKKYSGIV